MYIVLYVYIYIYIYIKLLSFIGKYIIHIIFDEHLCVNLCAHPNGMRNAAAPRQSIGEMLGKVFVKNVFEKVFMKRCLEKQYWYANKLAQTHEKSCRRNRKAVHRTVTETL